MITQTGILNADVPVLNWVTSYVLELTTLTRKDGLVIAELVLHYLMKTKGVVARR